MVSFVSSSLKTGRLIFIWPLDSWWGCCPWHGCLETTHVLDLSDTHEEVDAEPWSLSNPWSGEGKGNGGGVAHNSLPPSLDLTQSQSQPCCGVWHHSWYPGLGPCLGTSHHAAAVGRLAGHRDRPWLLKLNGVDAGGMELRCPGPPGLMCPSVMAWEINHQPSPRLTRLVLSLACLPTQLMAPDSMNLVSHTSLRLNPSPNYCFP